MSLEGKIQIQADLVPTNDNPRMNVTDNKYVKGAPQVFSDINELVAFPPQRLKAGNPATILNYPRVGVVTDFRLISDPSMLLDASGDSIITLDNFLSYWQVESTVETSITRVYQYSPDGPGGGAPVFPYTADQESNWVNTFDATKGHRWLRFRDDDVDDDHDGIFDHWTVPIPINNAYSSGDYLESRFKRQAVSTATHTSTGTMTANKYYTVEAGSILISGDLSLNDIGVFGTVTSITIGVGRRFKYASANSYTFQDSANVKETVPPPPRTVNGLPNNEPVGWSDGVPGGSDQLWQITGQKSVYGQLKSEWLIKMIIENPSYVRYNNKPTPHPDTLAGPTDAATSGSPEDGDLIAAGWVSVYDNHTFQATRQDDPDNPGQFTGWLVEKINEESGEYTDRVFKLFDINLDLDSPDLAPPTERDPTKEGWSDTPLRETSTQVNYVSEARKFFNGELKTSWSNPVPYTGQDIYSDIIDSDLGDAFKNDQDDNVTPSLITLKALLFKGVNEIWQDPAVTITYVWKKVFDNGSVVDIDPTSSSSDDFYKIGVHGSPGDSDYARANQRVGIKPGAVTGLAVFRCTQTIAMAQADDLVFEEEFSIQDVTDGKDAKSLAVTADKGFTVFDTIGSVFVPATMVLRVYTANIPSPTFYWYKFNGTDWDQLTNGAPYTITDSTLSFDSVDLFTADDSAEEIRFAVSTNSTSPDLADFSTTFSDYITMVKFASAGVGSDGQNSTLGILSNEAAVVTIDSSTNEPASGEIGNTGRNITTLSVYNGTTKLVYGGGGDYTIAVATSNPDITFDFEANGDDVNIFIDTWTAGERSANCTITITYGSIVFKKVFSVNSTLDAPGAILVDIVSDKGFIFTPADKSDKTLTAILYDSAAGGDQQISLPDAAWTFRWKVAGVFTSPDTDNTVVVANSDILVSAQVTLEVYKDASLFRSQTITIADVNDGKFYRAWTDNSTKPSGTQKLTNQDPTNGGIWPVTVNTVVWRLPTDSYWATHVPSYAQDATVAAGVYSWGAVYQLKGEKGDQGIAGSFFHKMYKASSSQPALGAGGSTSSLAQMLSAGWTSKAPSSGIIWFTERLWSGDGVTFNTDGDPSTSPVSGGVWTTPIKLSATDGINGDPGTDGETGWSPVLAIVPGPDAGSKVMVLQDWIGGTGSKPGHVGEYIAADGFVSDISLAQTVTGEPIILRFESTSKFLQWKYASEDDFFYRNLVKVTSNFNAGAFGTILYSNQPDFFNFTTVSSKNYPGPTTWTNTLGYTVLVEIFAMIMGRRDSGGSEKCTFSITAVAGTIDTGTGGAQYRIDGDSWQNLIGTCQCVVRPNKTLSWVANVVESIGSLAEFSDQCMFIVKIIDRE